MAAGATSGMSAPQFWCPTAENFTRHQLAHVTNFWRQGRAAEFRLKALPSGQAELCLTFELPSPCESIPPPINLAHFPPPVRSHFPQESGSGPNQPKPKQASPKVSSRQRKSYRRSVLQQAGLAASTLPPPKYGSLRQAASASVQRLQAYQSKGEGKRPLPDSQSVQSPMTQRIREDFRICENEVDSPEKEMLMSQTFPEKSPPPSSPCVKGLPPPAPLVFTPLKNQEGPQTTLSIVKKPVEEKAAAEKAEMTAEKCWNCDKVFTPDHQCSSAATNTSVASPGAEKCMSPGLSPKISDSVPQSRPSQIIKNLKKFCPVCETYFKASAKCQSCLPPAPPP